MRARVVQHARASVPRVGVGAGERKERERKETLRMPIMSTRSINELSICQRYE